MSETILRLNAALEGEGWMATVYLADDIKHLARLTVPDEV